MAVASLESGRQRYVFIARNPSGKRVTGAITAVSRQAAYARLTDERGLAVISLDVSGSGSRSFDALTARLSHWVDGFFTLRAKLLFFRQLAKFMRHGIPIEQALTLCADTTITARFREVLRSVKQDIVSGRHPSLSGALAQHEEFGRIEIAMVRAGEQGAGLPDVLDRIAFLFARRSQATNKIIAALAYPAFILVAAAAYVLFVVTSFVPAFSRFAAQFGAGTPDGLNQLVAIGNVLASPLEVTFLLIALVLLAVLIRWLIALPGLRERIDAFTLDVALLGRLRRLSTRSLFARLYSSLHSAGVPVLQSLEMIGEATLSPIYRNEYRRIAEAIRAGAGTVGSHLEGSRWWDREFVALVRAGELSASLAASLDTIALEDDVEIDKLLDVITKLFEPIMIVAMGGVVLYLVMQVYGSIYWLYGRIH